MDLSPQTTKIWLLSIFTTAQEKLALLKSLSNNTKAYYDDYRQNIALNKQFETILSKLKDFISVGIQ